MFRFGFNGGSTLAVSHENYKLVGLVCLNTAFASASGGVTALFYTMYANRKAKFVDVIDVGNGILSGLVGITAAAPVVTFWEAVCIGALTTLVVLTAMRLIEKHQLVDDPVGAFALHGCGGFAGLVWVGLFASTEASSGIVTGYQGLFHGGGAELLGKEIAGGLLIVAWVGVLTASLFFAVDRFAIPLRVPEEVEIGGLDAHEHQLGYNAKNMALHGSANISRTANWLEAGYERFDPHNVRRIPTQTRLVSSRLDLNSKKSNNNLEVPHTEMKDRNGDTSHHDVPAIAIETKETV